jgi:hypothetical protein
MDNLKTPVLIAPSLMAANMLHLLDEVQAVEAAGADWLHLDIMDGHFVPNLTFGPDIIHQLRPVCSLPFDVHGGSGRDPFHSLASFSSWSFKLLPTRSLIQLPQRPLSSKEVSSFPLMKQATKEVGSLNDTFVTPAETIEASLVNFSEI